jgi:hypothetical protein
MKGTLSEVFTKYERVKNEAAVALGRLRAAKGDLASVGSLGGLAARGKPRKRQPVERCECGKMSKARAEKRNHKCKGERNA